MLPSTLQRRAVLTPCADMVRACGLTLAELADELAKPQRSPSMLTLPVFDQRKLRAPTAPAAPAATKAPQRSGPVLSRQAEQVLEFASRPNGAIVKEFADLLGVDYSTAAYHSDKLVSARLLTKVKVRGEHAFRYWSNPAHALAYVEARAQEAEQLRQRDAAAGKRSAGGRTHGREAGTGIQAGSPPPPKPQKALTITPPKVHDNLVRPTGEPIKTEKTIETRDTTVRPTAKWQMQTLPPDPRFPSFSSMRLGVNPDTGKALESRA